MSKHETIIQYLKVVILLAIGFYLKMKVDYLADGQDLMVKYLATLIHQ